MLGYIKLASKYCLHHKLKSILLLTCLTLTIYLPFTTYLLVENYDKELKSRAEQIPLLIGSAGNRYDLVLSSLYYTGKMPRPITIKTINNIVKDDLGYGIPLHIKFKASGHPVIGVETPYYKLRGLTPEVGTIPMLLGDTLIGANVAKKLDLSVGNHIVTDQENLYDLLGPSPVKLNVVGILPTLSSPDDDVIFVGIKTAWVMEGLGHGHSALDSSKHKFLKTPLGQVIANTSTITYTEFTDENRSKFHFHGDDDSFPISAVIAVPKTEKAKTIIKSRINLSKTEQAIVPNVVIEELMDIVFRIKQFFTVNYVIILISTGLFLALIISFSAQTRKTEMQTIQKIGGSPYAALWIIGSEFIGLIIVSTVLAIGLSMLTMNWALPLLKQLTF